MPTVIIVDDHGGFRLSAKRPLETEGYSVIERAVEKHVTSIFSTLGLRLAPADHRRVLAVLKFLGRA